MDQFEEYYARAIRFLSYRPRSEKEVLNNLAKKNAPAKVASEIIHRLKKQKFLDDYEFTRWWIRQRTEYKPRSFFVIKRELYQKGVPLDVVESVFSEADEERIDELTMAKRIVAKRIGKYKHLQRQDVYQKLGQLLARRGFSWDVIRRAIDDMYK